MKKVKKNLEYIAVLTVTLFVLISILSYVFYLNNFFKIPKCLLYKKTNIYCLGCGSTRAVYSLLEGKILLSMYYNPFILYIIVIDFWYLITEGFSIFMNKKNKLFKKNINIYLCFGLIILIINWIMKTIMLFNGIRM